MFSKVQRSNSEKFVIFGIALVTLGINPFTSFEPFNAPKFFFLIIFSALTLFLLLQKISIQEIRRWPFFLRLMLGLFLIQSVLVFLFSEIPLISQMFGIDGRNTGFLTYLSFIIVSIYFILGTNQSLMNRVIWLLFIVGLINAFYGLIQYADLDPFNWTNPYSPVFGFYGNPNFQSALMGIAGSGIWAILFTDKLDNKFRLGLLVIQVLFIINLIGAKSQQGIIIFIAGLVFTIYFLMSKNLRLSKFRFAYLVVVMLGAVIAVLDVLQKVPWTSILYKVSVANRGDLWRSAWRMALDNPIFGVGFDGYEYFYREYRDETAIVIRGAGTTSNSAHNVFLDVLTNGGFPLFLLYLGINIYALVAIVRINKRLTSYQPYFVATTVAWVAFQLQSLISINHIGIAIWGWVLGGALIGYEIRTRDTEKSRDLVSNPKQPSLVFILIGITIGSIVGYQPMKVDINFREAIESKKIELVLNSAYEWPQSPQRMYQVAGIFKNNELNDLSYQVAKDAVTKFPRSFENWEILYSLPNTPVSEKESAFAQMKMLDPQNPALK